MKIDTERLELIPLTATQLDLSTKDISLLEKKLNFTYKAEPMEGFFLEIVKEQVKKTFSDEKNYMYHTFWLIIRKNDRTVVGSCDFKDVPNDQGQIEIGYGLGKEFEHNGYMTECVQAMCDWGLKQDKVKEIIAETEKDNISSQNILKRCNFKKYKEEETLWWKLKK